MNPASRHHSLAEEDSPLSAESLLGEENDAESKLLEDTSAYAFAEAGGKILFPRRCSRLMSSCSAFAPLSRPCPFNEVPVHLISAEKEDR